MTVRSKIIAVLALVAALFGAGCGGGESAPMSVETDEPNYRQGQQLVRQGRDAEALSMFLKVIERRGEQAAAESHLEAGLIFLNHAKNPIEAIHHFKKYLELQPNAKQAPNVRGLIETARREFARTLPGHPLESQVVGIDQSDRIKELDREVEDLKAENAALRLLVPGPSSRVSHTTTDAGETPMIVPTTTTVSTTPIQFQVSEPARPPLITAPPKPGLLPAARTGKTVPTPTPAGHRYTIAAGDTLYHISVKLFGNGSKVDAIFEANRDVMANKNTLPRAGTEIKIP